MPKKKTKKKVDLPAATPDKIGTNCRLVSKEVAKSLYAGGWWVIRHTDDGRVYMSGEEDIRHVEKDSCENEETE